MELRQGDEDAEYINSGQAMNCESFDEVDHQDVDNPKGQTLCRRPAKKISHDEHAKRMAGQFNAEEEYATPYHKPEPVTLRNHMGQRNATDYRYDTASDDMTPSVEHILEDLKRYPLSSGFSDEPPPQDDLTPPEYNPDDDDDSVTALKRAVSPPSPIPPSEREELLQMIRQLQQEQETQKKQFMQFQEEHGKRLEELVRRQPKFRDRVQHVMRSQQFIRAATQLGRATHRRTPPPPPHRPRDESIHRSFSNDTEHIYVQIEQLYVNWQRIVFQSNQTNDLGDDEDLYTEIGDNTTRHRGHDTIDNCEAQLRHPGRRGSRYPKALRHSRSMSELSDMDHCEYERLSTFVPGRPSPPLTLTKSAPGEIIYDWKISDFNRRFMRETQRPGVKAETPPFYLYHCGYRVKLEAYLNGNGPSVGKSLSVFLRLVRGEFDDGLKWPVPISLAIILINQAPRARQEPLKYSNTTYSFEKPKGQDDSLADAWGLLEFVSHEQLFKGNYIKDDSIKMRCRVKFINPTPLQAVPFS